MKQIMTVLGPVPPERLGFTSMHEHILLDARAMRRYALSLLGENPAAPVAEEDPVSMETLGYHAHDITLTWENLKIDDPDLMASEVADFKASGGSAIADMSSTGLRNDVPGLRRISEETGVHIIAPTGLYAEYTWPERFRTMSAAQYEDFMLSEITQGIEGTGIRPGHLKFAVESNEVTPQEQKMLRAVARVSQETGLSATIHSGILVEKEAVRRAIGILRDEGMPPERTLLCHMQKFFHPMHLDTLILDPDSWRLDLDFAKEILDLGMSVCIDCFGHRWDLEALGLAPSCSDHVRLAGIVMLVKEGYAEQIVIGTDLFLKINTRRYGGGSYSRLTSYVAPTLEKVGVRKEDVRRITHENPARILAFQG